MARVLQDHYLPGWREQPMTCDACGWQGDARAMTMELHDEATDYACANCGNLLLIVTHPTLDEVRAAAANGHPEAMQQLALLDEYRQWQGNRPGQD